MFKRSPILMLVFLCAIPLSSAVFLDVESGIVGNSYNDVAIPGDTGTRISLTDDLKGQIEPFVRVRAGIRLKRHTFSLLWAPLIVNAEGTLGYDVDYYGKTFTNGMPLNAEYKFNSYRLTWRYRLVRSRRIDFGLGLSLKIRDAYIRISDGNQTAEKSNVGFVPLINFRLEYRLNPALSLLLRGDALAAPQGRAEDVTLAVQARLTENLWGRIGYRILEGGADNDEVYNFTAFHYLTAGITWML